MKPSSVATRRAYAEPDLGLVVGLLRELMTEVRALRDELRRPRRQQKTLTRADRVQLARLLPVIADVKGSEFFTTAELQSDTSPALRIVLEGVTATSLGRLLRRALGVPVGSLIVQSDATEGHRRLWQIAKVIEG